MPLLNTRQALLVEQVGYNLRGGFLVRPLIIAVSLGVAGAVFSSLEEAFPVLSGWVPHVLFPSHADPQVSQTILGAIATAMMTVVSIVFAILLMTLTLASMQFSPRIIVSFSSDRVTQQTLGIFLGTFAYCLAAMPAARSLPHPFAPVATVMGAILLALLCIAWLLYFIHHISQAVSVNYIVDRIASETEGVIDEIMPRPLRESRILPLDAWLEEDPREVPVLSEKSGYVRYINTPRLVAVARSSGLTVRVLRRVGHFVPAGVPLMTVSRGHKLTRAALADLRGSFDIGPTRTLQQDIEYGILQIVDIALKAISPAVNDPSTAISCVDQLSRVLIRFASREPLPSLLYNPPGTVRVYIPWLGFDRLVESAFEQIRLYSKSDVAVNLRMLRALSDIAATVSDPDACRVLAEQGRRTVAGCAEQLGDQEMGEIHARLATLETFAAEPPESPPVFAVNA